ncbi:cyclase family protein [Dactylosporangium sp. CA-233914]|uniref:cyclase family protein n=1 Tax=Dactylosporangium sp. CA-233914 TaxID=3239934 RepID=UPI003D8E2176
MRRDAPSESDIRDQLWARKNWGRWGEGDQLGTVNLITQEKRIEAAQLVRDGVTISLSMPFPTSHSEVNPRPAQHLMLQRESRRGGGHASDYYGIAYHGLTSTHIDALCHVWDRDGIYGGRDPDQVLTAGRAQACDIDQWRNGLATRAVVFDVPGFRGVDFVEYDQPVHGWELEQIAESKSFEVRAGDALVVYCGRDRWPAELGEWGRRGHDRPAYESPRAGVHASVLEFIRDTDASMLVWDMQDAYPTGCVDIAWTVHGAIWAYGLAVVDNASLGPLVEYCRTHDRSDFFLVTAPLRVEGGTGSPVNPIAIL